MVHLQRDQAVASSDVQFVFHWVPFLKLRNLKLTAIIWAIYPVKKNILSVIFSPFYLFLNVSFKVKMLLALN